MGRAMACGITTAAARIARAGQPTALRAMEDRIGARVTKGTDEFRPGALPDAGPRPEARA